MPTPLPAVPPPAIVAQGTPVAEIRAGAQILSVSVRPVGDGLWLVGRDARGFQAFLSIDTTIALIVLADPRLEPLWPAILDWAGQDLSRLTARDAAIAREAWEGGELTQARGTSESLAHPKIRAALRYAEALWSDGDTAGAITFLDAQATQTGFVGDANDAFQASQLATRAARIAFLSGHADDAIARLSRLRSDLETYPEYAINADVNRAAYLAEMGRSAEALALIDDALRRFDSTAENKQNLKLRRSDAQFAWIRACALSGLGRRDEAHRLFTELPQDLATGRDRGALLDSGQTLRYRAARCMNDAPLLIEVMKAFAAEPVALLSPALLDLQPGKIVTHGQDALVEARRDAGLHAAIAGRIRVLPASLIPALNRRRATAAQ